MKRQSRYFLKVDFMTYNTVSVVYTNYKSQATVMKHVFHQIMQMYLVFNVVF